MTSPDSTRAVLSSEITHTKGKGKMDIKKCRCCGFVTYQLRKRVCPDCGVPAIWDRKPEPEEMKAKKARMQRLLESLTS